jgi:uncharacterized YigZ family protein
MGELYLKFVQKEFNITYEIKKSKFITHLCPYDKFDEMMERLKQEHPKGRHFVYAYRYLNEFGQVVENSSDDGEPKGTSGKPSLKVLAGNDVINSGVIIVRYFGGIRLGTGGLVRAYSEAVNLVCEEAEFKIYEKLETKTIELNYNELSKMEYKLNELGINIKNKEFGENVVLTLEAVKEKLEQI